MDELISLLPIIITFAIAIFAAKNSRKKLVKQEHEHEAPFPFFTEQNDEESSYDVEFTREAPVQINEQPQATGLSKLRTNYTEEHFKQHDNQDDIRLTSDKIDLRQAVIYSEILKPKFED